MVVKSNDSRILSLSRTDRTIDESSAEQDSSCTQSSQSKDVSNHSTTLSSPNPKEVSPAQADSHRAKHLRDSLYSRLPPIPPTDPATGSPATMSKLSPSLKQLINAPFSRPSYTIVNPSTFRPIATNLAASAADHSVGTPAWLTFSTATAMTMNAPSAMTQLWDIAQKHDRSLSPITAAELQREVGLKCISFNGIPRTINCLGAFYASLPKDVQSKLSTTPTRQFSPDNIEQRKADGLALWDSVYYGFERKLIDRLAQSHPDLPVHILQAHYSSSLSNPSRESYINGSEKPTDQHVGRVLTSLVAIACLRAQTGVGPQVVSHIFGLRKAYERGDASAKGEVEVQGGKWLSTEEGNWWILKWIDELVLGIGTAQEGDEEGGAGTTSTTYAPGMDKAKL